MYIYIYIPQVKLFWQTGCATVLKVPTWPKSKKQVRRGQSCESCESLSKSHNPAGTRLDFITETTSNLLLSFGGGKARNNLKVTEPIAKQPPHQ